MEAAQALKIPDLPPARLGRPDLGGALFARASSYLDEGLLRAMQWVVDSFMMPPPDKIDEMRATADPLLDPLLQSEPRRFFELDFARIPDEERSRYLRPLPGGAVIEREFRVPYQPYVEGSLEPAPARGRHPDRVLMEHWIHQTETPRATAICLHGFTMGRPRFDALLLHAKQWYERGLDVALLVLPGHGVRTPRSAHFSGEAFATPHVTRLAEGVRRSIGEIRQVANWLGARNQKPVGLIGLSLGGYLTALSASLFDDLAFAIPMVPPVCIGDIAWRFFERSRIHRQPGLVPTSFDQQELRAAFRVHSPLAHPLALPRERVLIIAGRGDRIVPPEHPNALWQHWQEPRIHWFNGSHLAPFGRARIVRSVDRHLARLGIL